MFRSIRPVVVALSLVSLAAGLSGCGPAITDPGGDGDGDGTGNSDGEPRTLQSCQTGSLSVSNESTTKMEDHFSDLPNQWAVAEYTPAADIAILKFGLSESSEFRETPSTSMHMEITLQVGDGSGNFSGDAQAALANAQIVGGDYIGDGKGHWAAGSGGGDTGSITGDWSVDRAAIGGRISGTVNVDLRSSCAPARSSATYQFDFDLKLQDPEQDAAEDCDFPSGHQIEIIPGTAEAEIDGEAFETSETPIAVYTPADDELGITLTSEDRELAVNVQGPSFGDNEPDTALYTEGDCPYTVDSSSESTVTIDDNDSGSLDHGPTSGSFDLQFVPAENSPSSCGSEPRQVTGSFGVGVCGASGDF